MPHCRRHSLCGRCHRYVRMFVLPDSQLEWEVVCGGQGAGECACTLACTCLQAVLRCSILVWCSVVMSPRWCVCVRQVCEVVLGVLGSYISMWRWHQQFLDAQQHTPVLAGEVVWCVCGGGAGEGLIEGGCRCTAQQPIALMGGGSARP